MYNILYFSIETLYCINQELANLLRYQIVTLHALRSLFQAFNSEAVEQKVATNTQQQQQLRSRISEKDLDVREGKGAFPVE